MESHSNCDLHSSYLTRDPFKINACGCCLLTGDCGRLFGEESYSSLTPRDEMSQTPEVPFSHNYLLNLFLSTNMDAFLSTPSFAEDVGALPFHMQCLIHEAKEEAVFAGINPTQPNRALAKLKRMRESMLKQSSGDNAMLMTLITELMADEDELAQLLEHPR